MPVVFNPFTGNLDFTDTTAAGGANTQVQFNDGGTLAGDTAFTWDKTNDQLTISGDVNLDTGGGFSTTIQSVTPTANRTISFPDQTGTVGLVAGATGNIQYNNAGQLAGTGDLNTELDWVSPTGTYTALKVNADSNSGNTGTLLDLQVDGTSQASIASNGAITTNTGANQSCLRFNSGAFGAATWAGIIAWSNGTVANHTNSNVVFALRQENLHIKQTGAFVFGRAGLENPRAYIYSDADGVVAQRNGTAAQTYRLYNTYTDASNYERLSFNWDTNVFKIKSEAVGTGTVRGIQLGSTSTEPVALFGATPVAQPTTAVGSATVAGGGGTAVDDATTFGGYTLAQVVQALQNLGILA